MTTLINEDSFVDPDRNDKYESKRRSPLIQLRSWPLPSFQPAHFDYEHYDIHAKSDARMTEFVPSGAIYAYIK